ncbi:hypothetical protein PVAP13_5KG694433 [Panicum virgatum]|uniref:Uncharacterized protein n=1 Tax=Panicum virgatum TaxID=38727 RepID=A0A8T0T2E5_PANVG|nr:hypothetical protein PVAP13_5KG694433 [Panicum virgatum]
MAILCLGATDKPQELDGVVLPQELVDDVIRRLSVNEPRGGRWALGTLLELLNSTAARNFFLIKKREQQEDSDMVRQCDRAIFEAQVEDERRNNNPPTFHGFAYSGETSDEEDLNDTYYYATP